MPASTSGGFVIASRSLVLVLCNVMESVGKNEHLEGEIALTHNRLLLAGAAAGSGYSWHKTMPEAAE